MRALRPRKILAAIALAALPANSPHAAFAQGLGPLPPMVRPPDAAIDPPAPTRPPPRFSKQEIRDGRDLFNKTWIVGERSRHGGDGLGPLFNASSCRECHDQGGIGGSGPANVELLTASASTRRTGRGIEPIPQGEPIPRGELAALHPAFRSSTSMVIHAAGADEDYAERRRGRLDRGSVLDDTTLITLTRSERNTPSLFGAGLIDRIPDRALIAAEEAKHEEFPEISGRISNLGDGRIGRFGWKGQTASLRDFVMQACANELGLEVPGVHQPDDRPEANMTENRLDLDEQECRELLSFVATLPAPAERGYTRSHPGRFLFEQAGCATCHPRQLGDVEGIYSDLLLHDIGAASADSGVGYYSGTGSTLLASQGIQPAGPAAATEWRTPPLWGVRDSAPYWHDGRAETLDAAIRLHQGEASVSTRKYRTMNTLQRTALLQFVATLGVPSQHTR